VQALKSHDEYSYTHSVNVAMLTVAIATSIGVSHEALHEIGLAALLHDVGKELIPLEILLKPGKLDDDEWIVVNRHGRDGARILAATEGIGDLPPIVSFEHHLAYHDELRTDPDWRPHLASSIVCIADVYDALRSERPYRAGMAPDKSMKIMQEDVGRLFDPDLFEGFFRSMGYFPPGTTVELADGTIAIVHSSNLDHPSQPRVLAVRSAAGESIVPPERLDLSQAGPEKQVSGLATPERFGLRPLDYLA
jgi:HD-GYP domain-containing protein (c-di-GMP phosphodiesterase class II)